MKSSLDIVKTYLKLIENCVTDRAAYQEVLHPEVEQVEFPNLYSKAGQRRSFEEIIDSIRDSREVLEAQRVADWSYTTSATGNVVAEMTWEGEMAIETNRVRRGQKIVGHFCWVFELREDKILHLRQYNCYELF